MVTSIETPAVGTAADAAGAAGMQSVRTCRAGIPAVEVSVVVVRVVVAPCALAPCVGLAAVVVDGADAVGIDGKTRAIAVAAGTRVGSGGAVVALAQLVSTTSRLTAASRAM